MLIYHVVLISVNNFLNIDSFQMDLFNFATFFSIFYSQNTHTVPRGNVFARFTHLQHQAFSYNINVTNNTGAQAMGTCRIFMAPRMDERGTPMLFRDQRLLMIEMDKFTIALNPGQNLIRRNSTDSSVTIPFERTFRDVDTNRPAPGTAEEEQFNFCGVRILTQFFITFLSFNLIYKFVVLSSSFFPSYSYSVDGHSTC